LDDRAFELGKHAKHLEHRFPGGSGRVESLVMQEEIDPGGVKLGAAEPIRHRE
jgi:hypothetical protein